MNIIDLTEAPHVAAWQEEGALIARLLDGAPKLAFAIGGFEGADSIMGKIAKMTGKTLADVRETRVVADWCSSNANNWQWYVPLEDRLFLPIYVDDEACESCFETGKLAAGDCVFVDQILG